MLRKLELQALRSDLSAVDHLLSMRSSSEDPIGVMQFEKRRRSIAKQIEDAGQEVSTSAGVALFFGGRPVTGSRGINAEFGARALEQFQAIISTHSASEAGPIASRGPVRQKDKAQLMITEVVRGSFGFVLEEQGSELIDTSLKTSLDGILDLIYRTSSGEEEAFEAAADAVDPRLLTTLTGFFRHLDENGATLRVVDDTREFSLSRDAIERARGRIETLAISETSTTMFGTLYVLPEAKRFELHRHGLPSVRGAIAPECLSRIVDQAGEVLPGLIGVTHTAYVMDREVNARGRPTRHAYTLIGIQMPGGLALGLNQLPPV